MRMDVLRGPDAATLLVRALRADAAAAGFGVALETLDTRPWASATFTGARHRLRITAAPVPGFRSWLESLPETELALHRQIVADLAIDAVEMVDGLMQATIAVLTLIDA